MEKKDFLQNVGIIKVILNGINMSNLQAVKAKDAYRAELQNLDQKREVWLPEEVDKLVTKEKQKLAEKLESINQSINKSLDDLSKLTSENDGFMDLGNPVLANALSIINNSKDNLSFEAKLVINQTFAGDQSSLKLLQIAYKSAGVHDAGLSDMIFNSQESITHLRNVAGYSFTVDGSLNTFCSEFSKFSQISGGVMVDQNPDQQGMVEKMRLSAGLK